MTPPQINTEQLRLYYLQQLGIAAYVPRELPAVDDVVVAEAVSQTVPQQDYAVMAELVTPRDFPSQAAAPQLAAKIAAEPRPAAARRLLIEDGEETASVVPATPVRTVTTTTIGTSSTAGAIAATTAKQHSFVNTFVQL